MGWDKKNKTKYLQLPYSIKGVLFDEFEFDSAPSLESKLGKKILSSISDEVEKEKNRNSLKDLGKIMGECLSTQTKRPSFEELEKNLRKYTDNDYKLVVVEETNPFSVKSNIGTGVKKQNPFDYVSVDE